MSFAVNSGKPVTRPRRASSKDGLVEEAQKAAAAAMERRPSVNNPNYPRVSPSKPTMVFGRRASGGRNPQPADTKRNGTRRQQGKSQSLRPTPRIVREELNVMTAGERQIDFFDRNHGRGSVRDGKADKRKGWNNNHHSTGGGADTTKYVQRSVGKDINGRDIIVKAKVKDDFKAEAESRLTKFGTTAPKSKGGTDLSEFHDDTPELTMKEMTAQFLDRRTRMAVQANGISNGTRKTLVKLNNNHKEKDISRRARAPSDNIVASPGGAKGAGATFVSNSVAVAVKPTAAKPTSVPSTLTKSDQPPPDRSRERPKGKAIDIAGLFDNVPAHPPFRDNANGSPGRGLGGEEAGKAPKMNGRGNGDHTSSKLHGDESSGPSLTSWLVSENRMNGGGGGSTNDYDKSLLGDEGDYEREEVSLPARGGTSKASAVSAPGGLASFATKFDRKGTSPQTRTPPGADRAKSKTSGSGHVDGNVSPPKSRTTPSPIKGKNGPNGRSPKTRSRSTPPMRVGRTAAQYTPPASAEYDDEEDEEDDEPVPPPPSHPPPGRAVPGSGKARQPPPAPMSIPAGRGKARGVSNIDGLSPAPSPSNEPPLGALLEALDQGNALEMIEKYALMQAES